MPRYETATHFWQIERAGAANTITTGKQGNKGRTTTKHHPSIAAAQTEHDRLVREKVKEGFVLVDTAPTVLAPAVDAAQVVAIEKRLQLDPYDVDAYTVLGDLLQRDGDPRGELIALQLAAEGDARLQGAAGKYLARHVEPLLGSLAKHVPDVRVVDAPPFAWRFGFLHRAELVDDRVALLEELLVHPSARLLAELAITGDRNTAERAVDLLVSVAPPSLRELSLTVRGPIVVEPLFRALPRLERVTIMAQELEVGPGGLAHARRATLLAVYPTAEDIENIARAPWPQLERLELRLRSARPSEDDPLFEDIAPLLRRADLPHLAHLRLRGAVYAGAILRALVDSPLAPQLELLDLSFGDMSPADTAALIAKRAQFGKLRELWLPMRHLRPQDRAGLATLAKHVIGDERAPRDRIEELVGMRRAQ